MSTATRLHCRVGGVAGGVSDCPFVVRSGAADEPDLIGDALVADFERGPWVREVVADLERDV